MGHVEYRSTFCTATGRRGVAIMVSGGVREGGEILGGRLV